MPTENMLNSLGNWMADKISGPSPVPALPALGPPPIMGNMGIQGYKTLADTTRPLLPQELHQLKQTFGEALDASSLRLQYDPTIWQTNIRGAVSQNAPSLLRMDGTHHQMGEPDMPTLVHEATHAYDLLGRVPAKAPNNSIEDEYDYGGPEGIQKHLAAGKGWTDFTEEQRAAIVGDTVKYPSFFNRPEYRALHEYIIAHPAHPNNSGFWPFIDSLRQRYGYTQGDDFTQDTETRRRALHYAMRLRGQGN